MNITFKSSLVKARNRKLKEGWSIKIIKDIQVLNGIKEITNEEYKRWKFQERIKKLGPEKSKEFFKRYPHRLEYI